jgi:hypothetical protein
VRHTCCAVACSLVVLACNSGSNAAALNKKKVTGALYLAKVVTLINVLQQHRGIAMAYVDGNTEVQFSDTQQVVAEKLSGIDRFDAQHPELEGIRPKWDTLKAQVRNVMDTWRDRPRECFARHTEVIASALTFLGDVATASGLRADTTPDAQALTETVTTALPDLIETLAQLNDMVAGLAAQAGVVREQEREQVTRQIGTIRSRIDQATAAYGKVYASNERLRASLDGQYDNAKAATVRLLDTVDQQVLRAEFVTMTPEGWARVSQPALESLQELHEQSIGSLQGLFLEAQRAAKS